MRIPLGGGRLARLVFCGIFALTLARLLVCAEPGEPAPILTILYTAEAHAALLPCDCPLQPLGGIARRAALIKHYRERGAVLLVDGGGWAAGGIYDEGSDGDPKRDLIRTDLMMRAMKLMNYDLVLATDREGDSLKTQFAAVANRYQISIAHDNTALHIPIELALNAKAGVNENQTKLWAPAPANDSAPQSKTVEMPPVILCRQGEDESSRLAASLNTEALILNAGRKSSQRISWNVGNVTLANFDYQAERLCVIEIFSAADAPAPMKTGRKFEIRVKHEALSNEVADDMGMRLLLASNLETLKKRGKKRVAIEFWTMPECPGCIQARPDLQRIATEMPSRTDISIHFVVHKENGKYSSLHGERELAEARIQALVYKYYPEKIWEWMDWREKNRDAPFEFGAKTLDLLAARLRGALDRGEADAILDADYDLMQRRHVDGTPSLVIANRLFDSQIERPQVLRVLCALLEDPKPESCKDVPACFFDAQCKKRGFIGKCIDAGKPEARCDSSRPAVKVPATVIVDRDNLHDNHDRIMELLLDDLPGIEFRVMDIGEPAAQELTRKLKIARLPAYILDPAAKTEVTYSDTLKKAVREDEATKLLVLQTFAVGSHRILNRPRIKGRGDLFVARLSKNGQEALETALEFVQSAGASAPELVLHDAVYWKEPEANLEAGAEPGDNQKSELAASGGIAELEEAARAMAIRIVAPDKLNAYLIERGKRRGSSYWDASLQAVGIDAAKVRALSENPSEEVLKGLRAEADLLKSLETGGDINFLAENCELIPIRSRQDLREILGKLSPKKLQPK